MTVTFRVPGAVLTEREHLVPLVHDDPGRGTITVFTREVAAPDGLDRPYLVFLQGGPGFEATRPTSPPSGWMARALADYRVLLLDQRGTGRSTPVGPADPRCVGGRACRVPDALPRRRDRPRPRADPRASWASPAGASSARASAASPTLTYLSIAPEGLAEALLTGGLAPVSGRPVDDVYAATWVRVREANAPLPRALPGRPRPHPFDRGSGSRREDVRLPSGDRLTARRFRQLGMWLGDSAGFEKLHHVLELPFGSAAFLHDVQEASGWERNPIYATLHESSYADGGSHPLVGPPARALRAPSADELLGAEHVFPWMWEDYAGLRPHREVAELLAEHPVAAPLRP